MTVAERSATLGQLDRIQPILLIASIMLGLGLASWSPQTAEGLGPLISIGVFALIGFVMLGVDLRKVAGAFENRRFVAIAVSINFVVNPLIAWGLGSLFLGSQPGLFTGFILFLVTPCIGWYLIFTDLAGGDTALGVSLLTVNIVIQILLLPAYMWLLAGQATAIDIATIISSVLTYLVAPLALAIAARSFGSRFGIDVADIVDRSHIGHLKTVILMVIVVSMFASQSEAIFANKAAVAQLIAPTFAFFAIAFMVALMVGRTLAMPYPQVALLAFTTTSRNSEASLAIAATAFASPLVILPVAIGPAIELPLLILMVRILSHHLGGNGRTSLGQSC